MPCCLEARLLICKHRVLSHIDISVYLYLYVYIIYTCILCVSIYIYIYIFVFGHSGFRGSYPIVALAPLFACAFLLLRAPSEPWFSKVKVIFWTGYRTDKPYAVWYGSLCVVTEMSPFSRSSQTFGGVCIKYFKYILKTCVVAKA